MSYLTYLQCKLLHITRFGNLFRVGFFWVTFLFASSGISAREIQHTLVAGQYEAAFPLVSAHDNTLSSIRGTH